MFCLLLFPEARRKDFMGLFNLHFLPLIILMATPVHYKLALKVIQSLLLTASHPVESKKMFDGGEGVSVSGRLPLSSGQQPHLKRGVAMCGG